jgi:hypothetical protein
MTNVRGIVFSAVLAAGLFASTGEAHALSCGSRLVEVGDSSVYVRSVCGDPTAMSTRTETRSAWAGTGPYGYGYGQSVTVQIEVWVYDFGPTRFMEELTFENGVLRSERALGYGTPRGGSHRREHHEGDRESSADEVWHHHRDAHGHRDAHRRDDADRAREEATPKPAADEA